MNKLTFCFNATQVKSWPKIKIFIDEVVVHDHCFSQSQELVDVFVELPDGHHTLQIERYGKTAENINFDSVNNVIIEDQTLELTKICIDDILLPVLFLYEGVWHWENHTEPRALFWGPNGHWTWKFDTPVIPWAISFNRIHQDAHGDMLTPYIDDLRLIYKYIDQLEKAISESSTKNSIS